ncbi:jg11201 [Pararge aegeria aegeria]|uniref:Jg11201 protein n=1 Tax=Pararge aegeria aegeria TaxID=348720 RepID=A0A8S4RKU1_9NEOP|nr:jg11201 [Pararge aegeria aegeria]
MKVASRVSGTPIWRIRQRRLPRTNGTKTLHTLVDQDIGRSAVHPCRLNTLAYRFIECHKEFRWIPHITTPFPPKECYASGMFSGILKKAKLCRPPSFLASVARDASNAWSCKSFVVKARVVMKRRSPLPIIINLTD